MSEAITLLPLVVPTALMLWLLRDVSTLKTMTATSLQKMVEVDFRVSRLERNKHDQSNALQSHTARLDLIEWRMAEEEKKKD